MIDLLNLSKDLSADVLDVFFPPFCLVCDDPGSKYGLCSCCYDKILFIKSNRCEKCGLMLGPHSGARRRCPKCETVHFFFTHTYALTAYKSPVRELIHALKYQKDFSVIRVLKMIIEEGLRNLSVPDIYTRVVPVPLYLNDEIKRGFNQAGILARSIARRLKAPYSRMVKKRKPTPKQVRLQRAERRKNLQDAFSCTRETVKHETVLLVDDVFTTGSTLSACAEVLKKTGGAKQVDTLVIAR